MKTNNTMKNWLYLIGLLIFFSGCQEKGTVKVSISFTKPLEDKQVKLLNSDQNLTQHSVYTLQNPSSFEEMIKFEKPGIYHFQISKNESVPIVISNQESRVELTVDNSSTPLDYTVMSSEENKFFKSYIERFYATMNLDVDKKLSFLDSISPSYTAAEIYAFEIAQFKGDYQASLGSIKEKYKGKEYAVKLLELISQVEKEPIAVGKKAPEFLLKSFDGKEYGPQSFKGKYLLLDFWASWCGPCRAEVPNVRKAYARYKDKGFEVLGVSTDQSDVKWKDAVDKLEMSWVSVRDEIGEVSSMYNIKYIPTVYLIGPDGIILAENVRGPMLEQLLEKYLGK